jgi:hypothetical protein
VKILNKKIFVISSIISILIFFSGCTEQEAANLNNYPENIEFESDIVNLVYAEIEEYRESGKLLRLDVKYLFENIAERVISFKVNVEFYDADNNLLSKSGAKTIENMPIGYKEGQVLAANIISYDDDVDLVHHVKIAVEEI